MASKRQLSSHNSDHDSEASRATNAKRRRISTPIGSRGDHFELPEATESPSLAALETNGSAATQSTVQNNIGRLSDELLVRILSYMDERTLLDISPVSRRFHRITADSQLWRPHFYRRFILPRAHRIPGFRTSSSRSASDIHYAANKSILGDGGYRRTTGPADPGDMSVRLADTVDWKKQYRLRHNWARGSCDVDEVAVSDSDREPLPDGGRTLVKVADGLAVTVDSNRGLRAWDLRTRQIIAQVDLDTDGEVYSQPSCLAVDGQRLYRDILDITVGFKDGTFGVWMLDIRRKKLARLYRHQQSFFGELASVAYLHPYILTATNVGFISLYSFEHGESTSKSSAQRYADSGSPTSLLESIAAAAKGALKSRVRVELEERLSMPVLLTSLKSHSTRPPLTLGIRRMPNSVIASIVYTFSTVDGWSIGIQDLDIKPNERSRPDVVNSRVAYTLPTQSRNSSSSSPEASPLRSGISGLGNEDSEEDGPIRLCYSHPYLLATMPDNTLVLYLCTSTPTTLTVSPGLRLWGHTSGISDAEITPRGKAVSVSSRGDEIRVWDLEGRVGGNSVEVRPRQQQRGNFTCCCQGECASGSRAYRRADLEDRRNWVGFDDEMVIVLKEAQNGRESLMVYDFT